MGVNHYRRDPCKPAIPVPSVPLQPVQVWQSSSVAPALLAMPSMSDNPPVILSDAALMRRYSAEAYRQSYQLPSCLADTSPHPDLPRQYPTGPRSQYSMPPSLGMPLPVPSQSIITPSVYPIGTWTPTNNVPQVPVVPILPVVPIIPTPPCTIAYLNISGVITASGTTFGFVTQSVPTLQIMICGAIPNSKISPPPTFTPASGWILGNTISTLAGKDVTWLYYQFVPAGSLVPTAVYTTNTGFYQIQGYQFASCSLSAVDKTATNSGIGATADSGTTSALSATSNICIATWSNYDDGAISGPATNGYTFLLSSFNAYFMCGYKINSSMTAQDSAANTAGVTVNWTGMMTTWR